MFKYHHLASVPTMMVKLYLKHYCRFETLYLFSDSLSVFVCNYFTIDSASDNTTKNPFNYSNFIVFVSKFLH